MCTDGICAGTAVDCSDAGDQCNTASCDPDGSDGNCYILTPVIDGTDCDDGEICRTDDACSGGECSGFPVECPEGEACDPKTGECVSECGPCLTDVDGDSDTGPFDLAMLLGCWGPITPGDACECLDADGDDNIGPFDLAFLLGNWGPCP